MRAFVFYPVVILATLVLGTPIAVLALLGRHIAPGTFFARAPGLWCRIILGTSGVRVVTNDAQRIQRDQAAVYVGNHVSWFDVFALGSVLPRFRFLAKKELASLPVFGRAVKEVAAIFIDRKNRRAAFDAYADAAKQIEAGTSVVVYPEGTRGRSYALRPFKKGPFVLAIAAQVPIVPVIIHGTREIQGKGQFAVHPGTAELTFLEPVPTSGMTYDDRDRLMQIVWQRMAAALEARYDVHSEGSAIDTATSVA